MTDRGTTSHRLLLELKARDAWDQRDYTGAQQLAEEMAATSLDDGDNFAWWNATFLVSECLRKQGLMSESHTIADELAKHPLTSQSKALSARVHTLRAFALHGQGKLSPAVQAARCAVAEARQDQDHHAIAVEAQNALIAVLAESGLLEEAWSECAVLAELLGKNPGTKYEGQSYWAIGNVAFLLKHIAEGVHFHQLAAKTLSPINDLDLWAKFNQGSAQFRLAAGITAPETLECIERAELADSIVGGTERDRLELRLTRAQWSVLTGQFDAAVEQLRAIITSKDLLASHLAAQAHLLLGQALSTRPPKTEALTNLEESERLFLQSGAQDRALTARTLIDELESSQA